MEIREKFVGRLMNNPADFGFTRVKVVNTPQVQTARWVRHRCRYICLSPGDGATTCPNTPTADETSQLLDEYKVGLMVHREIPAPVPEDLTESWKSFQDALVYAENESFKRGYGKAFAVGAGNCLFAHHDDSWRPCQYDGKRRPTLESVGVNLFDTLDLIGWDDLLIRDPDDPFHLFGLLLLE